MIRADRSWVHDRLRRAGQTLLLNEMLSCVSAEELDRRGDSQDRVKVNLLAD